MNISYMAGALCVASALSFPAHADWQYTKWGMSPEEALEASSGSAKNVPKPTANAKGEIGRLTAPYVTGDYEFLAAFNFDPTTNKLVAVQMFLKAIGKCELLRDELTAKYGAPTKAADNTPGREAIWLDASGNNRLHLISWPGRFCALEYSPLSSSSRKGL